MEPAPFPALHSLSQAPIKSEVYKYSQKINFSAFWCPARLREIKEDILFVYFQFKLSYAYFKISSLDPFKDPVIRQGETMLGEH